MTLASLKGQQVSHGKRNVLAFMQTVLLSGRIDGADHAVVPAIFGVSDTCAGVRIGYGHDANCLQ